MNVNPGGQKPQYWVVSPNVDNNNSTVSYWRRASILGRAAFMGYGPADLENKKIGYKFAHSIKPKHVILIARRYKSKPQIVGFGVVCGKYKRKIKGVKMPKHGSARRLSPFIDLSERPLAAGIRFIDALGQTTALAKLHPGARKSHKRICEWMDRQLTKSQKGMRGRNKKSLKINGNHQVDPQDTRIAAPPGNYQLDFKVRTKEKVIIAKKNEARLLEDYIEWLEWQDRELLTLKHGRLQCDGFEKKRRNLVEAKSSISREHIRMAVGQLLDYAFQAREKYGDLNKAILLPSRPDPKVIEWLQASEINLIWSEKGFFRDNANGQFTGKKLQ